MRQVYVTVYYTPDAKQADHGKQIQVSVVQVDDGLLKLYSNEHTYNPVAYVAIPLAHVARYEVKEYR